MLCPPLDPPAGCRSLFARIVIAAMSIAAPSTNLARRPEHSLLPQNYRADTPIQKLCGKAMCTEHPLRSKLQGILQHMYLPH